MQVKILQQLNSSFGTFRPGHIISTLPDDVASAWVEAGVAESLEVRAPAESQLEEPVPDTVLPRRRRSARPQHPSNHDGPFWDSEGND